MGFAERDLPAGVVVVAPPPLPPLRTSPALIPAHGGQRPLPTRPAAARPTTRPVNGTHAFVSALWDDQAPDLGTERPLLPPKPMSFDERGRSGSQKVIAVSIVVAVLVGSAGLMWNRSQAGERDATARAQETHTTANGVSEELESAAAAIADPSAAPSDLSTAAGVITRLSAVSLDLLGIGREVFPSRLGSHDPILNREAFLDAGLRAGELEQAMSQLLTARLVLEDLIELPYLTTDPNEAGRVGADLASALSRAEGRLVDVPERHAAIATDALATLGRIADRAAAYATDLRNGEPVGGHLSAFDGEVAGFAARLDLYITDQGSALAALRVAYDGALSGL